MRLVAIAGTDTSVGKTYVVANLARLLVARGQIVAARKPVQSYREKDELSDSMLLSQATGEDPELICPASRSFGFAMAPPIAAALLGRSVPSLAELGSELSHEGSSWPEPLDFGLLELVGGLRSPLCADGDCLDVIGAIAPDLVVLIAPSGLGVISAVRLCVSALAGFQTVVYLNRYDPTERLHLENLKFLRGDGCQLLNKPEDLAARVLDL